MNAAGCDSSLCYTYGGTIDPQTGMEQSEQQEMRNQKLWINMRRNILEPYCNVNCTKKQLQVDDQVIMQDISMNVTMEKVVLCEKIGSASKHAKDRKETAKKGVGKTGRRLLARNGTNSSAAGASLFSRKAGTTEKPTNPAPPPTPLEAKKKSSCFASRKCKVHSVEHGLCFNATSGKTPAEVITCPTGVAYRTDVAAKTNELVSTLCGNL